MTNTRLTALLSFALPSLALTGLAGGCNTHPIKPVDFDGSIVDTTPLRLDVSRKVDVLLVIDNSGSMGEEQANLATNFGPFIEKLEDAGADYRIAVTTTDAPSDLCPDNPVGGELHLSSCLDRPERFVFNGNDEFETACAAHCSYGSEDLATLPSATEPGGDYQPRPWIESYNGVSNLPEGIGTLEAFQCFAPQGISGCGWESPLEAMTRALDNMTTEGTPEHGFLRPDALLAVIVVTDEADCSVTPGAEDLLTDETFWAEGVTYATSAACWNAGVICTGDSPYEGCRDASIDAEGAETQDDSAAMLRPISRYVEALESVAATKLEGREVSISLIAGVPEGFSEGQGEIVYQDSDDPEFQALFGIGAGCEHEVNGELQRAVPPVRLKAVAEAFQSAGLPEGARNIYSVCADDYTPAILDIVAGIELELPPACLPGCVLDVDPSTDELDYSCQVIQESGDDEVEIPECVLGQGGHELPEGADACWIARIEDMDPACDVAGQNMEVELIRRAGVPVPGDVEVLAACELSSRPSVDCG